MALFFHSARGNTDINNLMDTATHWKIAILIACLLLAPWLIQAQDSMDTPFDKKTFPEKENLKKALSILESGDYFYEDPYSLNYDSALYHYLRAQEMNPNNADINLKIGHCYLKLSAGSEPAKGIPYLDRAKKLDESLKGQSLYYKGQAYHLQSEWRKAANFYAQYEDLLDPSSDEETLDQVRKRLEECRYGEAFTAKPINAKFEHLGDWVNSKFREHSPIISANASVMYFTARLPNTTGGYQDADGLYFEDVYVAYSKDGEDWSHPRNVGAPINTEGHDATVSLSADGQQMIIMREGDLYYSRLRDDNWTEPLPFPKNINGKSSFETAASYADDGETLYFISDRRESIGGKDIYVSYHKGENAWTDPKNLGDGINTAYDENGIFIHPDGTTMYFSSEGHSSIGGTDIFTSVKTEAGWSVPVNVGVPLNTPYDDQCIVVLADYKKGYYSTKGKKSLGDHDIFRISFFDVTEPLVMMSPEKKEEGASVSVAKTEVAEGLQKTVLLGKVVDDATKAALDATILIENMKDNKEVVTCRTDPATGRFMTALPTSGSYKLVVRAKGYLYHAESHRRLGEDGRPIVEILATLKQIIPNQTLVLKKVFFERASPKLQIESYEELNHLVKTLQENPDLVIEIGGHTDNIGNPARLQKLSELRMLSVRQYLVDRGIDGKRLKGKGYGGTMPIADNTDIEERSKNRRVEFKVLRVK